MNKGTVLRKLEEFGDAVIFDVKSKTYKLVTTDFSTPYIKRKKARWIKVGAMEVLVFSWTDDMFYILNSVKIKEIMPLASILRNKG